jgi:hypothetical protein
VVKINSLIPGFIRREVGISHLIYAVSHRVCPTYCRDVVQNKEVNMMGTFGGYTRWAVVFLIIFVLFFLLVPGYGGGAVAGGAYGGGY